MYTVIIAIFNLTIENDIEQVLRIYPTEWIENEKSTINPKKRK